MTKEQLRQDYTITFGTPEGKRVLHDLLNKCGVLTPTMVKGDTHMTAYNEGMRSVVLNILHILRVREAQYQKLAEEALNVGSR